MSRWRTGKNVLKNHVRLVEPSPNVALALLELVYDIRPFERLGLDVEPMWQYPTRPFMNERRPRRQSLFRVEHRRDFFVFHLNQVQRLGSDRFVLRRYRSDRIPHKAHLIQGNRVLVADHLPEIRLDLVLSY